jgi:hypothetical protein
MMIAVIAVESLVLILHRRFSAGAGTESQSGKTLLLSLSFSVVVLLSIIAFSRTPYGVSSLVLLIEVISPKRGRLGYDDSTEYYAQGVPRTIC